MIRHVVLWKIDKGALEDGESVGEAADRLAGMLIDLVGVVPGIKALSASSNGEDIEGNWDLGLVVDFADRKALGGYQVNPHHQVVVRAIKSVAESRACVDLVI